MNLSLKYVSFRDLAGFAFAKGGCFHPVNILRFTFASFLKSIVKSSAGLRFLG